MWAPGIVKRVLGLVSYQIEMKDGQLWKRHVHQIHGLKDYSQCHDKDGREIVEQDQEVIDDDIDIPVIAEEDPIPLR